jgi:cyclic pyranopterin phosphate synthase
MKPQSVNPEKTPATERAPLVDRFGRRHNSLRISVTDRCNIRCFYCMPDGPIDFLPRNELLSFEEIGRVVRVAASAGVDQIRITGGEPLVRKEVWRLVEMLRAVPGITDLAMTTNGTLLRREAGRLKSAGLDRLNISLDSIRPEIFEKITRRDELAQVLDGIRAASEAGFKNIRINAVSIAGLTEPDIVPLAWFCKDSGLHLRFIEFMPLDADGGWKSDQVLTGAAVRQEIEKEFGPLVPDATVDPHQPANDFFFADSDIKVGFINSVSQPFCSSCNRIRITAEGQLRNCLFSMVETDLRSLLRNDSDDDAIYQAMLESVSAKKLGHGIDQPGFAPPVRAMYQIGG